MCIIVANVQNIQVIGLVREMLSIDPKARPSMKYVVDFLGKLYYGRDPTEVSHGRVNKDDDLISVYH